MTAHIESLHSLATVLAYGRSLFLRRTLVSGLCSLRRSVVAGVRLASLYLPSHPRIPGLNRRARSAWTERHLVLSPDDHPGAIRPLILLAREHDHEEYQVREAAETLEMSPRTLHQLSVEMLGYPPGIVIDLARVESVAREIASTEMALTLVARRHGFIDQPAMNHRFVRFVGMSPGAYRLCVTLSRPRA